MHPQSPVRRLWVLVLTCALLSGGCAALRKPEKPKLSIVDVRLQDITLFEQRYRMTLRIQNPNNFALPIDRVYYEVLFEDTPFAEGNSVSPFTVPALGDTRFDVVVSTSLMRTAQHVSNLLRAGGSEVAYEMRGFAVIDLPLGGRVPFSERGSIALPAAR